MSKAKLTFLGTGTSQGIPMIGCGCEVCSSTDPQDKRLRSSVFVEYEGLKILVDAGPDFRYQMLREGITNVDAILLTHNHKDHITGLSSLIKKTDLNVSKFQILQLMPKLYSMVEYNYVLPLICTLAVAATVDVQIRNNITKIKNIKLKTDFFCFNIPISPSFYISNNKNFYN